MKTVKKHKGRSWKPQIKKNTANEKSETLQMKNLKNIINTWRIWKLQMKDLKTGKWVIENCKIIIINKMKNEPMKVSNEEFEEPKIKKLYNEWRSWKVTNNEVEQWRRWKTTNEDAEKNWQIWKSHSTACNPSDL